MGMHFRGTLDGITHYLVWMMVFIMPVFIPYFERLEATGGITPSLFEAALVYICLAPILCWGLTILVRFFERRKTPLLERFFTGSLVAAGAIGLYLLLTKLEMLPYALFISDTRDQALGKVSVWFSSFSNGKFFFTYTTTILATLFFLMQQMFNREHLVVRIPLRKTIAAFFIVHVISLTYPILYPDKSMLHESLMRLHQWIQYFLVFLIVVNTMTSLGRIYSIAKISSISGTLVAFVGLAQYFGTESYSAIASLGGPIQTFAKSYVFYNIAEHQPFGTFGHNNFAAAYVCLATPVTLALIGGLIVRVLENKKQKSDGSLFLLIVFSLMLFIQAAYLSVSVGKAGIVSMVIAVALCGVLLFRLFRGPLRAGVLSMTMKTLTTVTLLVVTLGAILLHHPQTEAKGQALLDKWVDKFQSPFDMKKGSNRVRISYAGGAMQLSRSDPESGGASFSPLHMLAGVGANNYKYHYPRVRDLEEANIEKGKHVLQAHCDFAQAAADTGVIGFFIFCLLIIVPIIYGTRLLFNEENLQRRMLGLGFLCTLVAMGVNSLFFFPFQTPGSLLPYFVSLGLLFSYDRKLDEIALCNRLSLGLTILVGLVFYMFEGWYSTRFAPETFWSHIQANLFIVSGVCALIYIVHSLLTPASKNWNPITVLSGSPALWGVVFVVYAFFSYNFSLTYLYTDYIKQARITHPFKTMESLALALQKRSEPHVNMVRSDQGRTLTDLLNEINSHCSESSDINDNNPETYQMRASAIHYYMSSRQAVFPQGMPGDTRSPITLMDMRIHDLEEASLRWPMNRDLHNQLVQDYSNIARAKPAEARNLLKKAQQSAMTSLRIFANEPQIMSLFLQSSSYLQDWATFQKFYENYLCSPKIRPFLSHEINVMLANHFGHHNRNAESLDILVEDFIAYPASGSAVLNLDRLLKENGQPKGVIGLLDRQRWDGKTVYENLITNRHRPMNYETFETLIDVLIKAGEKERVLNIQNWYLSIMPQYFDYSVQDGFRKAAGAKTTLSEKVDDYSKNDQRFRKRSMRMDRSDDFWFVVNSLTTKNPSDNQIRYLESLFVNFITQAPGHFSSHPARYKELWETLNSGESFKDLIQRLDSSKRFQPRNSSEEKALKNFLINSGLTSN